MCKSSWKNQECYKYAFLRLKITGSSAVGRKERVALGSHFGVDPSGGSCDSAYAAVTRLCRPGGEASSVLFENSPSQLPLTSCRLLQLVLLYTELGGGEQREGNIY